MQVVIPRLFDVSIMPEDSAFGDFVGAYCKLSLELVRMQSGVDIGAGAGTEEGVLDVEEDNIPARVLRTLSLPARNCLAGGGLVGSIFRRRWCVMSTCLRLPQLRERTKQRSGNFGVARLGSVGVLNIERLVYRPPNVV
jgi:hypothetical protein